MKIDTSTWSYHDFLAFLLLFAAQTDLTLTNEEQELIIAKTSEESWKKAKQVAKTLTDIEVIDLILSFKTRFFADEQQQEKLLTAMKSIWSVDDQFNDAEQNILRLFKKLVS